MKSQAAGVYDEYVTGYVYTKYGGDDGNQIILNYCTEYAGVFAIESDGYAKGSYPSGLWIDPAMIDRLFKLVSDPSYDDKDKIEFFERKYVCINVNKDDGILILKNKMVVGADGQPIKGGAVIYRYGKDAIGVATYNEANKFEDHGVEKTQGIPSCQFGLDNFKNYLLDNGCIEE